MATISSHVLDSVIGTHASGIRVKCYQRSKGGGSSLVFDVEASAQGRISENVEIKSTQECKDFELVFHSADYYQSMKLPEDGFQVLKTIVVRIELPDPEEQYHLPIMLSPHSYSVWWSGKPPEPNE